jgi:hypothetical protein
MTTDLREQLHALAEQRPPSAPPPDLWRRGTRRRRVRRAAAASAVVAALSLGAVLSTVGLDAVRTPSPPPAAPGADAAIPDRLQTPSPWLGGTEGDPVGPLAVIAGAERRTSWWGSGNGWAGVSAATGEYRFLDLPGAVQAGDDWIVDEADPVLSPDGRWVAYWLAHPQRATWVGGWAVYDTVTGDVVEHRIESRLGLTPDGLAWLEDGRLFAQHGVVTQRRRDGASASGRPPVVWSPQTGRADTAWTQPMLLDSAASTDRGLVTVSGTRLAVRDLTTGRPEGRLRLAAAADLRDIAVSPDGTEVVALPQESDWTVSRLLVGALPAGAVPRGKDGADVAMRMVRLDLDAYEVLGWRGPGQVLLRAGLAGGPDSRYAGVYAVDVRTGEHELLVRETRENWLGSPDYADDLWSRATVARPGPQWAPDPRWVATGGTVLAGAIAWFVLRRRRARR